MVRQLPIRSDVAHSMTAIFFDMLHILLGLTQDGIEPGAHQSATKRTTTEFVGR